MMLAVFFNHNSVVEILLDTPNIDVNLRANDGYCALSWAVFSKNNEALKLLLNVPSIDVNIVLNGESAVYGALKHKNIEGAKMLISHPKLTSLTYNQLGSEVMKSLTTNWDIEELEQLALLAADLNVDIDVTKEAWKFLVERACQFWHPGGFDDDKSNM